MISFLEPAFNL